MEKLSLSRKELENFASRALGIAKLALRRMSTQFLAQLLQMKIRGDSRAARLADEIEYLEKQRLWAAGEGFGKTPDEWIVFKCYNGNNYYLTMARLDEGDQDINQRVRDAYDFDFPFLRDMQRAN